MPLIGNDPRIDLMIAGFQKCGTTSLKEYLSQHPAVETHPQVECSFFVDDEQYAKGEEFLKDKYFSALKEGGEKKLLAKHAILFRHLRGLERLKKHASSLRIVLLLRDPVERAFSSYMHQRKMDQEKHSFREVLDRTLSGPPEGLEDKWRWRYNIYLGLGCYAFYLQRIFDLFPRERVHLFLTEELEKDPVSLCQHLFSSIDLEPSFQPLITEKANRASEPRSRSMAKLIRNWVHRENRLKKMLRRVLPSAFLAKSAQKVKDLNQKSLKDVQMESEERERLEDFYAGWNEKLEGMTGLDLSAWRSASENSKA